MFVHKCKLFKNSKFNIHPNTLFKLTTKKAIKEYFETTASRRLIWKKRNSFYHKSLEKYFSFSIPEGSRVLEVGCGTGELLAAVKPAYGVGIDFSPTMIKIAAARYPSLNFRIQDIEDEYINETIAQSAEQFDYIILSDLLHLLWDVQKSLSHIRKFCHPSTRIIISNYNFLWEPVLKFGERIGLKQRSFNSNWLSYKDIVNLLELEGFKVITATQKLLIPKYIPLLNLI